MLRLFRNDALGYSLLEILITLLIIGITLATLIPSLKHFYESSIAKNAGLELFHAIQVARNTALLTGKPILLCKSMEWQKGFIIKDDDKVLYAFSLSISEGVIHWRAFPNRYQNVEFLPTGVTKMENGTFWFCFKRKDDPLWAIILNQSGRIRMIYPDQNGKIYDDKIKLVKCL